MIHRRDAAKMIQELASHCQVECRIEQPLGCHSVVLNDSTLDTDNALSTCACQSSHHVTVMPLRIADSLLLLTVVFVAFSAGGSFRPTFLLTLCEIQQQQKSKERPSDVGLQVSYPYNIRMAILSTSFRL